MVAGKTRQDLDIDRKMFGSSKLWARRPAECQRTSVRDIRKYRGVRLSRCAIGSFTATIPSIFDMLWQILNQDLPPLIKALEQIVPLDNDA